ncbi:hypothetical protein [Flavobacterium sp.]|uniref:hypothetical protein n=1 Tax=Flavobacterium sp. TaxID=239 RepID=UPI002FD89529
MKIHNFIFFTLFIFAVGCQKDSAFQEVKINNQYALSLPKSLSPVDYLHEDASLQYQNLFTEFYTIVIDEPSKEFDKMIAEDYSLAEYYTPNLMGYANLLKDNLDAGIENAVFSELKKTTLNGNEALLLDVEGTVEGSEIYYQFAFIKGRSTYYQIVNWTELKRKENHASDMEKIIASFRELHKKKKTN